MRAGLDPFSFLDVSLAGWINQRQQQLIHFERNHQGLDNRLIVSSSATAQKTGAVRTRQRLVGMLNYYYREAA